MPVAWLAGDTARPRDYSKSIVPSIQVQVPNVCHQNSRDSETFLVLNNIGDQIRLSHVQRITLQPANKTILFMHMPCTVGYKVDVARLITLQSPSLAPNNLHAANEIKTK